MRRILFILFIFCFSFAGNVNTVGLDGSVVSGSCSNILTNGDFATLDLTGWGSTGGTFDASSGSCVMTNTSYGNISHGGLTAAVTYDYEFDITGFSATNPRFTTGTTKVIDIVGNGHYSGSFSAADTYILFQFPNTNAGETMTVDNVVICAQ